MLRRMGKRVYIRVALAVLVGVFVTPPGNVAVAQLGLPPVTDRLELPREPLDIPRRTRERVEETLDETTAALDTTTATVEELLANTVELANDAIADLPRIVELAEDPNGAPIEARTLVLTLDSRNAGARVPAGAELIARRELPSLGLTMLTLRYTGTAPLADALTAVRTLNPNATADYNHVFDHSATSDAAQTNWRPVTDTPPEPELDPDAPRIGVIDSAVLRQHRALNRTIIIGKDFTAHDADRPLTHGTAVASLVAQSSNGRAVVYSASVFFQLPNRAPGATAESLVAALDWLLAEKVDAINMSLAGAGSAILELAVDRLIAQGGVIVAAVGNAGPNAPPQYPAAYDGVIGVTAVDQRNKVFRYANRGDYVDFAARGVNVRVADSTTGGWRIESGTSMASPHIAVIVADARRNSGVAAAALPTWLMTAVEDLGRKGHDPVFGHGLITTAPEVVSSQ